MDATTQECIMTRYVDKESYETVFPLLVSLNNQGLHPYSVTMDGHRYVIQAIKNVWPKITLQRCLFHIQREGLRWLRTYPKTEAGKQLKALLSTLSYVRTITESHAFIRSFDIWKHRYQSFVSSLPRTTVAFKDLKRTMALIAHALPDMFHYLRIQGIASTTNMLEGFYSHLKADYRRHNGMSKNHRIAYLKWYCYLKSKQKNNIL